MNSILLNASGHQLTEQSKRILLSRYDQIVDIVIPIIDPSLDISQQVATLLNEVNSVIRLNVPVAVILPGYSALAVILTAYLHGLLGYFPEVCLLDAASPGSYLPARALRADMGKVRMAARRIRQYLDSSQSDEIEFVVRDCINSVIEEVGF